MNACNSWKLFLICATVATYTVVLLSAAVVAPRVVKTEDQTSNNFTTDDDVQSDATDGNEKPGSFPRHVTDLSSLHYSVIEESGPATFVGDLSFDLALQWRSLSADDVRGQGPPWSNVEVGAESFQYLDASGRHVTYFDLDERSGLLTTSKTNRLDRELICGILSGSQSDWKWTVQGTGCCCQVTFDVIVRPGTRAVQVRVDIVDINDNSPLYSFGSYASVGFYESSEPGFEIAIGSVTDSDDITTGNGLDKTQIESSVGGSGNDTDSTEFALVARRRRDEVNTIDLSVVLLRKLDRESDGDFRLLTIVTYDGGRPRLMTSAVVNITIVDVNDNSPVFVNSTYQLVVREDVEIGTVLTRVSAIDPDDGLNGRVEYTLEYGSNHFENDKNKQIRDVFRSAHQRQLPFHVDRETGEVYVVGSGIDFEAVTSYNFDVVATDCSPYDRRFDRATLYIRVDDVNDNAPEIRINTPAPTEAGIPPKDYTPLLERHRPTAYSQRLPVVRVPESAEPESFVAHLSVVDPDSGLNGQCVCFIDVSIGRTLFALNRLYDGEYVLVTSVQLDREHRSVYDVAITCTDVGLELSQVSVIVIRVEVSDVNDNAPTFVAQNNYRDSSERILPLSIFERNVRGCLVKRLSATDSDAGVNAEIVYGLELPENAAGLLEIDVQTGIVRAMTSFQRDLINQITFNATATDRGQPPRTTRLGVTLEIAALDGRQQLAVDDVWEPPETLRAASRHHVFHVYENQPVGFEVGSVFPDDVMAETLLTSLVAEGNDIFQTTLSALSSLQFYFAINGTNDSQQRSPINCCEVNNVTGSLFTKVALDRESRSVYHFSVLMMYRQRLSSASNNVNVAQINLDQSEDECLRPKSSSLRRSARVSGGAIIAVTVRISDVNDNIPTFIFPNYINNTVFVTQNDLSIESVDKQSESLQQQQDRTTFVPVQLRAIDLDRGMNADIRYSIVGGSSAELFDVDPTTGQLLLTTFLFLNDAIDQDGEIAMATTSASAIKYTKVRHPRFHTLLVEASDCGYPRLFSRAWLNVVFISAKEQTHGRSSIKMAVDMLQRNVDDAVSFDRQLSDDAGNHKSQLLFCTVAITLLLLRPEFGHRFAAYMRDISSI